MKLNLPALGLPLGLFSLAAGTALAQERPNILVVYAEDISTELGCYGFAPVHTPNLDRLAAEGVRFASAFTTSPVCSASRSALFTGAYQTRIGAHNHRTHDKQPLPEPVRPLSHLFRDGGYRTLNFGGKVRDGESGDRLPSGPAGSGKTDLNFTAGSLFDSSRADFDSLPQDRPWIGWLTIQESHKGYGWPLARKTLADLVDPAEIDLPPYWPDHPVARDEFANYLDAVSLMDHYFGTVLANLEASGQAGRTIVVFLGDNGRCLFRDKQFLYDTGIRVPVIVRFPDGRRAGSVVDDLVSGVDIPAMLLAMAALPVPDWMDGRDLLDPAVARRDHVIAARDRCDMATDRIRAVRDHRYKYIRNFLPAIPYMQWNPYKEREYPTWNLLLELKQKGRLTPAQALFTAPHKPIEELYDLASDPHEIDNLALDPAHRETLLRMRGLLDAWLAGGPDAGAVMEDPLHVFQGYFGHGRMPEDFTEFQPLKFN